MELKVKILKIDKKIKIAMFMLIIKTFLSYTTLIAYNDMIDNILAILATFLFVLCMAEKRYSKVTLIIYSAVALVGFYSAIQIGNVGFLITIITCFAIRKEDIDKIIKYIYQIELLFFLLIIIMSCIMSLIGDKLIVTEISGEIRYNFGFTHPNTFSMMLFNLILMWVYINFDKIKRKNILEIALLTLIVCCFTKTRTFLVNIVCLLLLLVLVRRNKKRINNIISIIAQLITPMLTIITYVLTMMYMGGNNIAFVIDNILSYRIRLVAYALYHYGISLFGQNMSNIKVIYDQYWKLNNFTFDNAYVYFMSNIGIIWLIIICICFYLLAKKKNVKTSIFIIAWALYGMTEVHGINGYECFPILLCATLLNKREKNKNGKYYCTNL